MIFNLVVKYNFSPPPPPPNGTLPQSGAQLDGKRLIGAIKQNKVEIFAARLFHTKTPPPPQQRSLTTTATTTTTTVKKCIN